MNGTVIKSTGSWYRVRMDGTNEIVEARILGKFRLQNLILTNPVAVGDVVTVRRDKNGDVLIQKIMPRRNYVARQSPRQMRNLHLLASNVDQTVLFTTIVEPDVKLGFIDRFLLMTEPQNIPTVVVFNKSDLYLADKQTKAFAREIQQIYKDIGYQTITFSALDGTGHDELKLALKDKITLLAGQSGVGKSSAVNAIESDLSLRTSEISEYSGKGQHTTTFAEMHPLSFGGYLIDTPGIKTLSFNNLTPLQVAQNFREIFNLANQCKFGGTCLHQNEPNCAVKDAITGGGISESRYDSFSQILQEVKDLNYWERHR
ncbi:MAG: hypothetical protein RL757_2526 [Bacteroidota bacterium]